MATPKKPVSKKPVMKKSAKDSSPPKATGKAVSGADTRRIKSENIKYYDGMLDSAGDILDYPAGHKLHKQAAALLGKYNYASKDRTRVAPGNNPYAGVSQRTANALSRDYNILMKAVNAHEKAPVKGRASMGRKSTTPKKK
jgi:hypothetical protein